MAFGYKDVGPDKKSGYSFRGQEVLLTPMRGFPRRGMIPAAIERGIFTPEKQIEITTVFAVTGDVKQTSEITKVDPKHVRNFLKTEEFRALFEEFRTENAAKFEAKFAEALEKVQEQILNRVEHGDVVLDKEGTQVRVPVKARDLGVIANVMFDKLQLLRGKPTSRTESTSADGKLEQLAQKFIELAGKATKKRPIEVITDAEYVKETSETDGSGGPQPSVRQEGGSPS